MTTYYIKTNNVGAEIIVDVRADETPFEAAKAVLPNVSFTALRIAHKVGKPKADAHVKAGVADHRFQTTKEMTKGIGKLLGL